MIGSSHGQELPLCCTDVSVPYALSTQIAILHGSCLLRERIRPRPQPGKLSSIRHPGRQSCRRRAPGGPLMTAEPHSIPPWLATVLLAEDDTEESVMGSDWHQEAIFEAHGPLLAFAQERETPGPLPWYVSSQA